MYRKEKQDAQIFFFFLSRCSMSCRKKKEAPNFPPPPPLLSIFGSVPVVQHSTNVYRFVGSKKVSVIPQGKGGGGGGGEEGGGGEGGGADRSMQMPLTNTRTQYSGSSICKHGKVDDLYISN